MSETTYNIKRLHFNDETYRPVLAEGLTLEEAQAWCSDPETSSRSCTRPDLIAYTEIHGPWFDSYGEDD